MKRISTRIIQTAASFLLSAAALFSQSVTVAVSPASDSTPVNGSRQFTATVSGAAAGVTWSVNGVPGGNATLGVISATGLYKAPAAVPVPNVLSIRAVSTAVPTAAGAASITIRNQVPWVTSVSPSAVAKGPFTLTVTGSRFVPGAFVRFGSLTLSTVYVSSTQLTATGDASGLPSGPVSLTVTNPDPGAAVSSALTVQVAASNVTVSVTPPSASVALNQTQQLTASVAGDANTAVTWSVNGVTGGNATVGTVTSSGLYKAPAAVPNPATVSVRATSVANAAASATASITILPAAASISSVNPFTIPAGAGTVTISGAGFQPGSQVTVGGTPWTATFVSSTLLSASGSAPQGASGLVDLVVTNPGPVPSAPYKVRIDPTQSSISEAAAARFLQQAAFGPTEAAIAQVRSAGFEAYLDQQFNMPPVSGFRLPGGGFPTQMGTRFFTNAVHGPDQLRLRVAFALSQIYVVSLRRLPWPHEIIPFQEMLTSHAFGNVRNLLKDMARHPVMGYYLDNANNAKADPIKGTAPNENFARELLQLFTIGTVQLNPDGTPKTGPFGLPLPAYDQAAIVEFARAMTGWTYAPKNGAPLTGFNYYNSPDPMVAYAPAHDTGPKTLLNGTVLAAGATAEQDLDAVIDHLVAHPNAGPFFARRLIQHLVTSNPSPAYIQRVAAAFANNGAGVRGDIKAVVRAILLDSEARQADTAAVASSQSRLQDPALFVTGLLRALNATVTDENYLPGTVKELGQTLYASPTVFNYYSPDYRVPGAGLYGPEFEIHSPYTALFRTSFVNSLFSGNANIYTSGPGLSLDLTPFVNLAANPANVVDAAEAALLHGRMPDPMRDAILTAVEATSGNLRRAQMALFLIASSSHYQVRR